MPRNGPFRPNRPLARLMSVHEWPRDPMTNHWIRTPFLPGKGFNDRAGGHRSRARSAVVLRLAFRGGNPFKGATCQPAEESLKPRPGVEIVMTVGVLVALTLGGVSGTSVSSSAPTASRSTTSLRSAAAGTSSLTRADPHSTVPSASTGWCACSAPHPHWIVRGPPLARPAVRLQPQGSALWRYRRPLTTHSTTEGPFRRTGPQRGVRRFLSCGSSCARSACGAESSGGWNVARG